MIKTDVIIIGGGATGTGIARDMALRGIDHCLIEKKDFAAGATGACHGLLHSGGRYTVKDPEAARECITENTILRRIGKKCVEPTEGLFVRLPGETLKYRDEFLKSCIETGIKTELLSASEAFKLVPNLNSALLEAIKVPDASIDPFRLCMLNVVSSQKRGGKIFTHHKVIEIVKTRGQCTGVKILDKFNSKIIEIEGKLIINATGAWGSQIAQMAGSDVPMSLSKGSLIIANHRLSNLVINRLRPSSNGDIIVPNETVSLAGTTSIHVDDPDSLTTDRSEIDLIRSEAAMMIPDFNNIRLIRSYTGVRPLLKAADLSGEDRSISRGFQIIDHKNGMFSILGGKLTTYRLMAEKMTDRIMDHFGIIEKCTTADVPLEGQEDLSGYPVSKRLGKLEDIMCECELVSRSKVKKVIKETGTKNLGDIQHRTRLGMGPCQGGFCTYRALGIMQETGQVNQEESLDALKRFLQRRYKGSRPLLYGDQLREEQLVEGIYLSLLGMAEHEV
ncbi:MAG: anaerobic glycerol-3-phosphate dehydrogenase subunit A [Spirochaetia bacterium]|jgi:glycerol-3-phosphate dehydrogenase|nr:anaerobic glycerol-3-phosphate dehydrogenase subunit A [Spirochaetia bacterium]